MPILYFTLIAICMIAAFACDLCHWSTAVIVGIFDVAGLILTFRHIRIPRLSRVLGVVLYFVLVAIDLSQGGGIQVVFLNLCLDLVWALMGFRAIQHESLTERLQVGILSVIPLACVAIRLQASTFLTFLFIYFIIWAAFLCEQSLSSPTSGNIAFTLKKKAVFSAGFWLSAAGLLICALLFGSTLFLVVPRYSSGSISPVPSVEKTSGQFPDVALDKTGEINVDPTLIFHAVVPVGMQSESVYWRVEAQNVFDGTKWQSHYSQSRPSHRNDYHDESSAYHLTFAHDWHDYRIPTIVHTTHVSQHSVQETARPVVFYPDDAGIWHRWGWNRQNPLIDFDYWYDEHSLSTDTNAPDFHARQIWPSRRREETTQRLTDLAEQIVGNAQTNEQKAVLIRNYLQTNFQYSLNRPPRTGFIVEDFLYRQPVGHCEVFSTTMAVLLARLNVPVRNVTGFVSGEFRDGENFVRAAHAHSWVEVWLDSERGWVVFDPTPSGPQIVEVDWLVRFNDWFSTYQTRDLYRWLQAHGLSLLAVLLGLVAIFFACRYFVRYFRLRFCAPVVTCRYAWDTLQRHLSSSPLHEVTLETWWSENFDVSLSPIQLLAKRYIQIQYRQNQSLQNDSLNDRYDYNSETLKLLSRALKVKLK